MFVLAIAAFLVVAGGIASNQPRPYAHVEKAVRKVVVTRKEPTPETDLHLYDCINGQVVRYQGMNLVMVTDASGEPMRCPRERAPVEKRQVHPDVINPELGADDGCPGTYTEEGCKI